MFAQSALLHAEELIHFDKAAFIHSTSMTPPKFDQAAQLDLPHRWKAEDSLSGWYQIEFTLDVIQPKNYAVYLPSLNMNAEVFLNGEIIGSGGSMVTPVSRHWHEPLLFSFPSQRLNLGTNTLHIHVASSWPNMSGHLAPLSLGLAQTLQPIYNLYYFEKQTIYIISIMLSLLLGGLILYLWHLRKQREYLWFAATCFVWGLSSFDIVLTTLPVSMYAWQILILWLVGWMPVTLAFFLYGFMRIPVGKLGRFTATAGFILFPILWLVPTNWIYPTIFVWFSITMWIGIHTIVLLYKRREQLRKRNKAMFRLLFASIVVCYIFAIHDFLYIIEAIDASSRLWLGFAIPIQLIAISILLVQQFVQALKDVEDVNITLKERISDAEEKIKDDYEKIADLETANAIATERKRIYGDLHDDLGAKLLSLVYKSETDEQKQLAKQAMDGLREIVKNTPSPTLHTAPILAWRKECQQRALEHQAKLQWLQTRITDAHPIPDVTSIQLANVLREAISNALKHGDGTHIQVKVQMRFGFLFMSVFNPSQPLQNIGDGQGKNTMQHRIQSLGGIIKWRHYRGCHVSWIVPLTGETS